MAEITRDKASEILSSQKASDIIKPDIKSSVVLSTFPTVQMSKKTLTMTFLDALPTAGFVGESATAPEGIKPQTDISWTGKQMVAEEIAVIVPIHENVLDDADIDIFAEVRPLVAQEFGRVLDRAVLYGTKAPATWADANVVAKAIAAGNTVTRGTTSWNGLSGADAKGDLASDFNAVLAALESDDFDATDVFAVKSLRAALRGLRDQSGAPIYLDSLRDDSRAASLYGAGLSYLHRSVVQSGANAALALAVDRTQFQVGIREDIQVKFLDQATLTGPGGTQVNLAERDMVALRFKFRVAFGSKFTNLDGAENGYPAAVLRAA